MDRWNLHVEVLLLEHEPDNSELRFTVAIRMTGSVVGHASFKLASLVSAFLRRDIRKGSAEVAGPKINRGTCNGLER